MDLRSPVIFNITDGRGLPTQNGNIVTIPMLAKKADIENVVLPYLRSGQFDYGVVSYDPSLRDWSPIKLSNTNRVTNTITNTVLFGDSGAFKGKLPVFDIYNGKDAYLLNPVGNAGSQIQLDDVTIANRMEQFTDASGAPSKAAWGAHQAQIYDKFRHIFGLTDGNYGAKTNHKADLTNPKRGLSEDGAVKKYGMFSWKGYQHVAPGLIGDDLVGIRGFNAKSHDYNLYMNGQLIISGAKSINTIGSGIVLPMKDAYGNMSNFQLSTDLTPAKVGLKFRADDGNTIAQGHFSTKEQYGRTYHFKNKDGQDVKFKVKKANNEEILFEDIYGEFKCPPKQELVDFLRNRGYDLPLTIASIKPEPNGKYVWPAPGSMANDASSPSRAGFIHVNQPKNGQTGNVVLVVEGALKGIIVAEYLNRKDKMGVSLADRLAGDLGIIVAQVPGVSDVYIQSIDNILETKNVHGVLIAMDADGRDNLNVCKGIHNAFNKFDGAGLPTKVISWDPNNKGLDDAMLAISRGELTYADLGLEYGTATELFPLENASAPVPYDINGNPMYGGEPSWQSDWSETKGASALAAMKASGTIDAFTATALGDMTQTTTASANVIPGTPAFKTPLDTAVGTSPATPLNTAVEANPVTPANPVVEAPTNPVTPLNPVVETPINPVTPANPVVETTTSPVAPVNPVVETPTNPITPVNPVVETPTQQTVNVTEKDVETIIKNNQKRFENDEEFLKDIKALGEAAKHLSTVTENFVAKYS